MKRSAKQQTRSTTQMLRKKKRRGERIKFLRQNTWLLILIPLVLVAIVLAVLVIVGSIPKQPAEEPPQETAARYESAYLCAVSAQIPYYDDQLNESGTVSRGLKVTYSTQETLTDGEQTYYLAYFDDLKHGYISGEHLTASESGVVQEKTVYVRTPQNLRTAEDSDKLGALVEQGTELTVAGYDYLQHGVVHLYEVRYQGESGYISGSYVAGTLEDATEVYDRFGVYMTHSGREDRYGGGDGGSLDYYPREKASFADNVMPEKVYALYLTCDPEIIGNIEGYIEFAKSTNINAFVVNIIDGTSVGYPSDVYKEYSPTSDRFANNTQEEYGHAIARLKEEGFYVIGRLTTFNDSFFVADHPEYAISDGSGSPLYIAASHWPSPYCRYVWEYKIALAKEAVELFGFQEIQFDYVRFPDGTYQYEESGGIDYHNTYGETKAQAIQRFLMYACDELHDAGVYVSADVFGETNNSYVTSYGQYWPAISNVVDVISGMPYPDHFAQNGTYRPWEHPYETILEWAQKASVRQSETPTPAIARTWIQAYDAIKTPYNVYGAEEIAGQIRALEEGGLSGGFMAWHAACSIPKLETFKAAFDALPVQTEK